MNSISAPAQPMARWMLMTLSTVAFTLLFNVWLMLGVLAPKIKESLGLSAAQVEWLIATAILSGALLRLNLGVWADRYGGHNVMMALLLLTAVPTYLFGLATTYAQLLACTLLFGLAGNAFTAGVAWNAAWFPPSQTGLALGVFGAGNVGASGTKLLVGLFPAALAVVPAAGLFGGAIPSGWRAVPAVYASLLVVTAVVIFALSPTPDPTPGRGRPLGELLSPLRHARVWRFSLYYAAVLKYVPNYFPRDVGAVGGLVGMLGALGGFVLPPIFGALGRATGVPQAAFLSLLVLTLWSLAWLHVVVTRLNRDARAGFAPTDGPRPVPARMT